MEKVSVHKLHSFTGHHDSVYTLQPSAYPHLFFSAAGDGMLVLWDLEKPDAGVLIAKLPNSVYALHYHPQTKALLAGHNYDGLHVLDWEQKKELASLHFTKAPIFDIQSAGPMIFVGTGDGVLAKIDLHTMMVLKKVSLSSKNVRTIAVNERLGEVAVGYSDHHIRVLDIDTLQCKREWIAHTNSVFTLRYSPDGALLLSGSRDARIKAWDIHSGYQQAAEVVAHLFAINHLEFSPDGKHFVTCSMDKSIKVWDLAGMKLLKVIDKARHAGHGTSVNKLLWTSYRSQLISASDDRSISAWDINFVL